MNITTKAFSLIELIIVLAIISILTTIAYPIYQTHITKTHRTKATIALTNLAAKLEQYYTQHHSYQHATLQNLHATPSNSYYQFAINSATDNSFIIKATPIGSQAKNDHKCGALILNELGKKTISGNGNIPTCWP